jgi:hypothetical protein
MEKALKNTPVLDPDAFRQRVSAWKSVGASRRVIVEWSTGTGPSVFVCPAGSRNLGFALVEGGNATGSDERWADFLEFTYLPQVADALRAEGYDAEVLCVDLRPLVVQRARRRQIEAAARAKAGVAAH